MDCKKSCRHCFKELALEFDLKQQLKWFFDGIKSGSFFAFRWSANLQIIVLLVHHVGLPEHTHTVQCCANHIHDRLRDNSCEHSFYSGRYDHDVLRWQQLDHLPISVHNSTAVRWQVSIVRRLQHEHHHRSGTLHTKSTESTVQPNHDERYILVQRSSMCQNIHTDSGKVSRRANSNSIPQRCWVHQRSLGGNARS